MSLADQVGAASSSVEIVPGFADTYPNVKIGGVPQPAAWPSGVYAAPGEAVFIAQLIRHDAPAQNVVLGRVGADGPREGSVTTVPGGSDTITVTANAVAYTATFLASYAPAVGDRVRLLWQGPNVTVVGKVGVSPASAATTVTTQPPPPALQAGTFNAPANDSATYWSGGGWDSIAGGGGHLYQGTVYGTSASVAGAWFYGNTMAELAGANITRVQFRVPRRFSVGSYNDALQLHLYAHTNPSRPSGDVNRVTGPQQVTIAAGWNPGPNDGWVDLPLGFAPYLINGGGVSIAGDPYMGFYGRPSDSSSGQLHIDWNRNLQ